MSDTLLCPNCQIPYQPLSENDKRQLALAKSYERACPRCFFGLGEGDSTPENIFERQNFERSYYLGLIQTFRTIETAATLLQPCEVLRTALAPESQVRYAWANVAPEFLPELWAVMDKIGGTVPARPEPRHGRRCICDSCIQDVLRAIDAVVNWCEAKRPLDGPTTEGLFIVGGTPHRFPSRQWRLLKALYQKGSVGFEAIGQEVWGDCEWLEGRLRKLVSDTNEKLHSYKLRFEIISDKPGHYILQELPPVTPPVTGK
jgi:hypothetical protein